MQNGNSVNIFGNGYIPARAVKTFQREREGLPFLHAGDLREIFQFFQFRLVFGGGRTKDKRRILRLNSKFLRVVCDAVTEKLLRPDAEQLAFPENAALEHRPREQETLTACLNDLQFLHVCGQRNLFRSASLFRGDVQIAAEPFSHTERAHAAGQRDGKACAFASAQRKFLHGQQPRPEKERAFSCDPVQRNAFQRVLFLDVFRRKQRLERIVDQIPVRFVFDDVQRCVHLPERGENRVNQILLYPRRHVLRIQRERGDLFILRYVQKRAVRRIQAMILNGKERGSALQRDLFQN